MRETQGKGVRINNMTQLLSSRFALFSLNSTYLPQISLTICTSAVRMIPSLTPPSPSHGASIPRRKKGKRKEKKIDPNASRTMALDKTHIKTKKAGLAHSERRERVIWSEKREDEKNKIVPFHSFVTFSIFSFFFHRLISPNTHTVRNMVCMYNIQKHTQPPPRPPHHRIILHKLQTTRQRNNGSLW